MCYSENMIKTLTTYEVAELLLADSNANWSRSGALALAEYLEGVEIDSESISTHPMEFDLIAIRCEWTEFNSAVEAVAEIGGFVAISNEVALEYLKEKTEVIEFFSIDQLLSTRLPPRGVIVRMSSHYE